MLSQEQVEGIIQQCRSTDCLDGILHHPLLDAHMADAFAEIEKHGDRVDALVMSSSLFKEWISCEASLLHNLPDSETIWGALIVLTDSLDDEVLLVDRNRSPTRFTVR